MTGLRNRHTTTKLGRKNNNIDNSYYKSLAAEVHTMIVNYHFRVSIEY